MNAIKHYYSNAAELQEITELTRTISNVPGKTFHKSWTAETYWRQMMTFWKANIGYLGCNVVYAALHVIHWGTYPNNMPQDADLEKLVTLLSNEFLKVTPDLEQAKQRQFFNSSLTQVLKSHSPYLVKKQWKSEVLASFREAKTSYRLYGGEIVVKDLNLLNTSMDEFRDMKARARVFAHYSNIKNFLIKFIPAAKSWSDDEFSDDSKILNGLNQAYGVDLAWCRQNFDQLYEAYTQSKNDRNELQLYLNIKTLPNGLRNVIWPQNTNAEIEQLFVDIYNQYKKYSAFASKYLCGYSNGTSTAQEKFHGSWLYNQIREWHDTGSYALTPETKICYFNLDLGIF